VRRKVELLSPTNRCAPVHLINLFTIFIHPECLLYYQIALAGLSNTVASYAVFSAVSLL